MVGVAQRTEAPQAKGWLAILVGEEVLPLRRCLSAIAGVAAITFVAGTLLLGLLHVDGTWRFLAQAQMAGGSVLLLGAAVSWLRKDLSAGYLFLVGVLVVVLVFVYPVFVSRVLAALATGQVTRVAHAPGVLAFGLAFGARLLLDYGPGPEERRRSLARLVGILGLVVGGALDVIVLFLVFGRGLWNG